MSAVTEKLAPLLHRDFLKTLPKEIALQILTLTNKKSLGRVAQVSRTWFELARDNSVWKLFYLRNGWTVNDQFKQIQANHASLGSNWTNKVFEADEGVEDTPMVADLSPDTDRFLSQQERDELIDGVWTGSLPRDFSMERIQQQSTENTQENSFFDSGNSLQRGGLRDSVTLIPEADQLDWRYIYRQRLVLESNWIKGIHEHSTLIGHIDAVYCLQYNKDRIISGARDGKSSYFL